MKINSEKNMILLHRNQDAEVLKRLLGKKQKKEKEKETVSEKKDTYVKQEKVENGSYTYLKDVKKRINISDEEFLRMLNDGDSVIAYSGGVFEVNGISFTADQIPKIDKSQCEEIKAQNNVMDFGKDNYFKYVSKSGEEYYMYVGEELCIPAFSEYIFEEPDNKEFHKYGDFWRYMMSEDPVYLGLSFTDEEVKAHFEEAGITPGFFTVKMGNYEMTQYYSQSDVLGIVQSKERYDEQYEFMTQSGRYGKYVEPGSVIRIHGKEYAIDENNNVQIPYGEDIFSAEEVKK